MRSWSGPVSILMDPPHIKTHLHSPALMMDIMIRCVERGDAAKRVKGQGIATMIVNHLECRKNKKPHGLASGQSYDRKAKADPDNILDDGLDWM